MLLPALSKARETSRRITCTNNLKNIGTAMHLYVGDYNGWSFTLYGQGVPNSISADWIKVLSKEKYLGNLDTTHVLTTSTAVSPLKILSCPSRKASAVIHLDYGTNFHLAGFGKYAPWQRATSYGSVAYDTQESTLFKLESVKNPGKIIYWSEVPRGYIYYAIVNWPYYCQTNQYCTGIIPAHNGTTNAMPVDGHVESMKQINYENRITNYAYYNNANTGTLPD